MRTIRDLWRDRRGTVSVYFAAVLTAMVLLVLSALDLGRVALLRQRLQAGLDAAVLAAGYNMAASEAEWKADATAYFNANMGENMMGATLGKPTFNSYVNAQGTHVTMTAGMTVPLMISAFTQAGAINLSLTTGARKRTRANVEMVLAMDNTGSMADDGKMTAARAAATQVVSTMLGTSSGGNTYVGLVPFNETVKVGNSTLTRTWLAAESGYDTSRWRGCLFERKNSAGRFAVEKTAPNGGLFRAYRVTESWDHEETRRGDTYPCVPSGDKDTSCKAVGHKSQETTSQSGCVTAPVNFLTANQTTLNAAITAMNASGSTMVAAGVTWGWRMLAPEWRGWWEANSPLPKTPGNGLNKALVLLTDGDNEVYAGYSWSDGTTAYYSPYGDASATKPWGDITGKNNAAADALLWNDPKANAAASYCEAAKADGIVIYTIPFGTNISDGTDTILRGCASSPDKYFRVTASTDLAAAFLTITDSLSELVIEQ